MTFFKNTNKLIFIVISFVITLGFNSFAVAADNNQQNHGKNKAYVGSSAYAVRDTENTYIISTPHAIYGLEFFCDDHSKLKIEGGYGKIDLGSYLPNIEISSFEVGLEHYHQNYIGEIRLGLADIENSKLLTIGYTAGYKLAVTDATYITSKLRMQHIIVDNDNIESKFSIDPKITIGTNIEVPDTLLSINPEVYFSPTAIGASINVDINAFFLKLETNVNSTVRNLTMQNTALTFGVNF